MDKNIRHVDYRPLYAPEIKLMMESQKYTQPLSSLPKTGIFVFKQDTPRSEIIPVAVGFLRLIEGGYAQLDSLISNGGLGSYTRHLGMTLLVNELILKAQIMRIKGIISYTKDEGIRRRAKGLGFTEVQQTILSYTLGS